MFTLGPVRTDFADFLRTVADVDVEIHNCLERIHTLEIEKHITTLKAFRNTLVPAGRVPVEIMQQVFCEVVRPSRLHDDNFSKYEEVPDRYHWICITRICSRWRRIAIDLSSLWTDLDLKSAEGYSAQLIGMLLRRSGGQPLALYRGHLNFELLEQKHRIQHLYGFTVRRGFADELQANCGVAQESFHLPLLESFQISGDISSVSTEPRDADFSPFLSARLPALKNLSCDYLPWSVAEHLMGQGSESLVRLTLRRVPGSVGTTLDRWLDLLKHMPRLQELKLMEIMLAANDLRRDRISHAPSCAVHFSHMREVHFGARKWGAYPYFDAIPHLLPLLRFPLDAKITIDWRKGTWGQPSMEVRAEWVTVLSFLAQHLTITYDPPLGLSLFCDETTYTRSIHLRTDAQDDRLPKSSQPRIQAFFLTQWYSGSRYSRDILPEDFIMALADSPLSPVISHSYLDNIPTKANTWLHLATSFDVSHLHISSIDTVRAFLEALERSLTRPSAPAFFPRLHSLSITVATIHRMAGAPLRPPSPSSATGRNKGLMQRFSDALAVRQARGLGPTVVDTGAGGQDVDTALSSPGLEMRLFEAPVEDDMEEGMLTSLFAL